MHAFRVRTIVVLLLASAAASSASAQTPPAEERAAKPDPFANIKFEAGPIDGKLENIATIKVQEGMAFVGGRVESGKFIEATQNLVSHREVGIIVPTVENEGWWLDFEFDPIGYVKDDEKGELDADKILEGMRQATERGNEERKRRGWEELHVAGWHTPPRYNPATHNLEWATRLRSATGAEDVNYNVRLLGRRGVMSVTLVARPDQLEASVAKMQNLLGGFTYIPEESYSAFKPGDKVAEYGLTALVVGGTLAVAAKSGILGKIWKFLVAGVVVIGAALRKLFGGKKADQPTA